MTKALNGVQARRVAAVAKKRRRSYETAGDYARALGVTDSVLSEVCSAHRRPSHAFAAAVAREAGVEAEALLTGRAMEARP